MGTGIRERVGTILGVRCGRVIECMEGGGELGGGFRTGARDGSISLWRFSPHGIFPTGHIPLSTISRQNVFPSIYNWQHCSKMTTQWKEIGNTVLL